MTAPRDDHGDRVRAADHRHVHAYDSATSPDHEGRITVTERCHCGAALRSYLDSIV